VEVSPSRRLATPEPPPAAKPPVSRLRRRWSLATVTWLGGDKFSLYIADTTQGWSHTTDASLTSTPARSSAEVIVEAPCCTNSGGILPLSDFGTVNYGSSTANGTSLGSQSPTEIIMIDNAGRDKDSISSLSGGENFSATWLRSN